MADEPQITLDEEDFINDPTDVKEETVEQPTTAEESSPKEQKDAEPADPSQDDQTQGEDEASEDQEAEDQANEDETTGEEQPTSKAEERKTQLNSEIRDLVSQRNAIKAEVEQLNNQVYAPESVQDLVNQGMSETDARIAAMEQRMELSQYNDRVAEAQLTISAESQRVLSDFPMFDPSSQQYKPEVATQAAEILKSALVFDQNTGQVVGSNVSPYALYKTINDANQASAVENQLAGQKATEQMLAAAEPQSSAVPKEKKEDPFLAGLLGNA